MQIFWEKLQVSFPHNGQALSFLLLQDFGCMNLKHFKGKAGEPDIYQSSIHAKSDTVLNCFTKNDST